MADVILEKSVYFLGSWKTEKLSDKLLKEITSHSEKFRGLHCILSITDAGVRLDDGGTENSFNYGLISEKNILEIFPNRLEPHCVICVIKDGSAELNNVIVWRCRQRQDATDILMCFNVDNKNERVSIKRRAYIGTNGDVSVQTFKNTIQHTTVSNGQVSSTYDGHVTDDHNKITINGQAVSVFHNPIRTSSAYDDVFVTTMETNGNNYQRLRDTGVQTDPIDFDRSSLSDQNNEMFRDELQSLQREVKKLKLMVQAAEVSNAQYFVRRRIRSDESGRIEYVPVHYEKYTTNNNYHRHRAPNYDIRSYAIQTDRHRYTAGRRTGRDLARNARKSGHYVVVKRRNRSQSEPRYKHQQEQSRQQHHYRIDSDTSTASQDHPQVTERLSSDSDSRKKVLGYVTLPPENTHSNSEWHREPIVISKWEAEENQPRFKAPAVTRETVQKPIENVYGTPRYRKSEYAHRSRKGITPDTFVSSNGHLSTGEEKRHYRLSSSGSKRMANGDL